MCAPDVVKLQSQMLSFSSDHIVNGCATISTCKSKKHLSDIIKEDEQDLW